MSDNKMVAQVAALTIILDIADELLYSLLVGVERPEPLDKSSSLINRDSSLIGSVQVRLISLLDCHL